MQILNIPNNTMFTSTTLYPNLQGNQQMMSNYSNTVPQQGFSIFTTEQNMVYSTPKVEVPEKITQNSETTEDKVLYNDSGFAICGHLNQHKQPCKRIGYCPFHGVGKRPQTAQSDGITKPKKTQTMKKQNAKKIPYKRGWTKEEHLRFLIGLQIHGKGAWKAISSVVQSKTPTQIQSHAQKYFLRQQQKVKNKRSIHDFTIQDLQKLLQEESRLNMSGLTMSAPHAQQQQHQPIHYSDWNIPRNFMYQGIPSMQDAMNNMQQPIQDATEADLMTALENLYPEIRE
jgi:SHAQKYF class myb-like DNA-binding protein